MTEVKRQARCWICGVLFEAERGSLPKGARFACERCVGDGLGNAPDGTPPPRAALARVLYERHGVPYLDLANLPIEADVLRLVPEDFARHHSLIPVMLKMEETAAEGGTKTGTKKGQKSAKPSSPVGLVLAMCDPDNRFALESIKRRIEIPVKPFVSTWAEISEAIYDSYLEISIADDTASE